MFHVRLSPNRHEIEIEYNGRPIRVDSAEIRYEGKRRMLVLTIADFKLQPDSQCPERHRFERVLRALGDSGKIAALLPVCSLIQVNANACDGCPQRPI